MMKNKIERVYRTGGRNEAAAEASMIFNAQIFGILHLCGVFCVALTSIKASIDPFSISQAMYALWQFPKEALLTL